MNLAQQPLPAVATSHIGNITSVLFGIGLLVVVYLDLLPALLAGLLVYALVHALVPLLRGRFMDHQVSRVVAVTLIAFVVITLITLAGIKLGTFLQNSGESVPLLFSRMAEIIEGSRAQMPAWLLSFLPDDSDELRIALVEWLKGHSTTFQVAGTGLGRALAHILIGLIAGGLLSLEAAVLRPETPLLTAVMAYRAECLVDAFRRVVFAQFWISAVNTTLTAMFLVGVLPMLGVHLPFTKTLILITFVVGLIPIIGNLISNTAMFIVGLSQSLWVAMGVLLYLMLIHKLEYFLNARIVGGQIRARAWELLLVMLIMEAAFGIPGLIAAPIYYAYVKEELRGRGLL